MMLADYVAQFLRMQGVGHVFGLPGGESVTLVEALRTKGIEFVLFSHEAAAGYAADVTGQLTQRPGVCLSTVGPGAVNLVAAAAAATLERSPMLAITADIDSTWPDRVAHMKLDLNRLFGSVTKGSFRLERESFEVTLASAWQLALSPPFGAVHISLSPDQAIAKVSGKPSKITFLQRPAVSDETLSQLKDHLQHAEDLIIIAGLGVEAAQAHSELLALAEQWGAVVAVTPKAKGFFPESHSLFAGCFTAYGDAPLREAISQADLVLGVGLDSVDFVTSTWDFETPVINLNLVGADDPALKPVMAINGDLRDMLRRLVKDEACKKSRSGGPARAGSLRKSIARQLHAPVSQPVADTIPIQELIRVIQSALPTESAVTVDVGAFKLVFLQQWRVDRPKSLFVANGLSAMGYAIPGALGIRLAQPQRPVLAIVGDGALLMVAGELATVARIGLPLIILVIVDEALSLIRLKQLRQELPIYGTELGRSDYSALAGAFGLKYRLIDGQPKARAILEEAVALPGPVLVEARITNSDYDRFR